MTAQLPEGAPLPPGWGEDRRAEAAALYAAYRKSTGPDGQVTPWSGFRPPGEWFEAWAREADQLADLNARAGTKLRDRMAQEKADRLYRQVSQASRPKVVWRDGTWLAGQQFDPVRFIVPGVVPEGVTLSPGAPKSGKSFLWLAVGLSAASGGPVLGGAAVAVRPVAYFALEDSDRRMQDRCRQLGWEHPPPWFRYTTRADPGQVLDELAAFLDEFRNDRPLAILDTWGRVVSPAQKGETTYERDYRIGTALHEIVQARPGSSLVIPHHTRKEGAADWVDMSSGTHGLTGAVDTIALLDRKRGENGARLLVAPRDWTEGSYLLEGFPRWRLAEGDPARAARLAEAAEARQNLGDRSTQVLNLIESQGRVTTAEVAGLLGISSDAASAYLGRLARSAKIYKRERGVWGSLNPPVGSVRIVGNPHIPTHTTGDTRNPGGIPTLPAAGYDFGAMWRMADHEAAARWSDREAC